MALLEKLLLRFGYVKKSSKTLPLHYEPWFPRWGKTVPEDYSDFAKSFCIHPRVYSCVFLIASSFASVPFKIYERRGDEVEEVSEGRPFELFQRVNEFETPYDLWEKTAAFLEISGNAFWELELDEEEFPTAIYVLRPDRVRVLPGREKPVEGYVYTVNERKISFLPEEIIHLSYFNPLDDHYGLGSCSPLRISLVQDFYAQAYNQQFFKNYGRIGGFLQTDQKLDDEVFERLRARWEEYRGVERAHRVAILEQGLKFEEVGTNPKDAEFSQSRRFSVEEICAAFGVPPVLVADLTRATYENIETARKLFWENTMIPKLRKVEEKVTELLLPRFSENLFAKFDLSEISALKEDEDLRSRIDERLVSAGIETINERRRKRNLPDVPWGDVWHKPANLMETEEVRNKLIEEEVRRKLKVLKRDAKRG